MSLVMNRKCEASSYDGAGFLLGNDGRTINREAGRKRTTPIDRRFHKRAGIGIVESGGSHRLRPI